MSRYIDADALYETLCRLWDKSDSEDFEKNVFKIIINAPSIDIVRCKECKNKDTHCDYCHKLEMNIKVDDFCSYGEREGE